jgi:hypothetical protein
VPTESFKGLEAAIEAWNRRDIDTVMERINEDVVWRTGDQFPDIESVYEGHEGVRRFFQIFRYDEEHRVRDFWVFPETDKGKAFREAGLDE